MSRSLFSFALFLATKTRAWSLRLVSNVPLWEYYSRLLTQIWSIRVELFIVTQVSSVMTWVRFRLVRKIRRRAFDGDGLK